MLESSRFGFEHLLLSLQVMSSSLGSHGLQHTRPRCRSPSLSLEVCSGESGMISHHLILCNPLLFMQEDINKLFIFFLPPTHALSHLYVLLARNIAKGFPLSRKCLAMSPGQFFTCILTASLHHSDHPLTQVDFKLSANSLSLTIHHKLL